jgi:hypothetical protein
MVFFYDIEYTNKVMFAVLYVIFVFFSGFIFFYTRKSFITKIVCLANTALLFPILLLDWGNLPLIIPAVLLTIFGFFASGLNPTAKTIFGTIILLIYIIGSIAFYFVWYVFRTTTEDTLTAVGIAPSGSFSYYVLDVKNNASGKIEVFVKPEGLDKTAFGCLELKTTLKKRVKQQVKPQNGAPPQFDIKWDGQNLLINNEIYFYEDRYFKDNEFILDDGTFTYTYFQIEYPISTLINETLDVAEEAVDRLTGSGGEDSGETSEEETAETTTE